MSADIIAFLSRIGRDFTRPELAEEARSLANGLSAKAEPIHRGFSDMAYCPIGVPVLLYLPTTTEKFGVFTLKEYSAGLFWENEDGGWLHESHRPAAFMGLDNLEALATENGKGGAA